MARDLLVAGKDVVVVHSSDLHMDQDYTARLHGGDGTAGLAAVLAAAQRLGADVVVLAGDTFECHRVSTELLDRAARLISTAGMPVVLLPGNHDPAGCRVGLSSRGHVSSCKPSRGRSHR